MSLLLLGVGGAGGGGVQYAVTNGEATPHGHWAWLDITDPVACASIDGGVGVRVSTSANSDVDWKLLSTSATHCRLLVEVPPTVISAETFTVTTGAANPKVYTDWGPSIETAANRATGTAAPRAIVVKTVAGGTPLETNEWAHPYVLDVHDTSLPWLTRLSDSDVSGSVTHIRADTPLPNANDDYEGPVLFYSTDDCATWNVWPSREMRETPYRTFSSDYMDIADNSEVSLADTEYTIACYAYTGEENATRPILCKGTSADVDKEYCLFYKYDATPANRRWGFSMGDGANSDEVTADTLGEPTVGEWYLVVAYHNPTTNKMQIGPWAVGGAGGLESETSYVNISNGQDTASSLAFGRWGDTAGGNTFTGRMFPCGMWSRKLTTDEIAWMVSETRSYYEIGNADDGSNLKTNMVAWWEGDGVTGDGEVDLYSDNDLTDQTSCAMGGFAIPCDDPEDTSSPLGDPMLVIESDGTLRLYYVRMESSNTKWKYRPISGSSLMSATYDSARVAVDFTDNLQPQHGGITRIDSTYYIVAERQAVAYTPLYQADVWLWSSADGVSFTSVQKVISRGGENDQSFWHGGLFGPYGGYYYHTHMEHPENGADSNNGHIRMYRSTDLLTWEAQKQFVVFSGSPRIGWVDAAVYMSSLFRKTDGTFGITHAGFDLSSDWGNSGDLDIGAIDSETIDSATAFGYDLGTSAGETAPTDHAIYDLGITTNSGFNDLSGNARTLSVESAPVYAEGTGYTFDKTNSDALSTPINAIDLGQNFVIEFELTPVAADTNYNIFIGEQASSAGATTESIVLYSSNDGTFRAVVRNQDGTLYDFGAHGSDARGNRTTYTFVWNSANSNAYAYQDGTLVDTASIAANKTVRTSDSNLWIGGMEYAWQGLQYGNSVIHSVKIWTTVPARYQGAANIPVSQKV